MATQAKRVFDCCPAAVAAAADDGGFCVARHSTRVLACNLFCIVEQENSCRLFYFW